MDNFLQFKSLKDLPHFTTTSKGGVSSDTYKSFNLGYSSGDVPENVTTNREILIELLNAERLIVPFQTHGSNICVVDENFLQLSEDEQKEKLYGNDAVISNVKNIAFGISTADCVPLIIYDPINKVSAAIHAGWKGTVARIASLTVKKMVTEFNSDVKLLKAGIGPAISQKQFEVGNEVVEQFKNAKYNLSEISIENPNSKKLHLDLWKANKMDLQEVGLLIDNIEVMELCTYSNPEMFFSARRQGLKSGRMLTGFVIK